MQEMQCAIRVSCAYEVWTRIIYYNYSILGKMQKKRVNGMDSIYIRNKSYCLSYLIWLIGIYNQYLRK